MEEIGFPLRTTLFSVLKTMAIKASQSKLDLLFKVDPAVEDFLVGDPFRLRQIITNLCVIRCSAHLTKHFFDVPLSCVKRWQW